jgi:hypothetical protein
LAQTVQLIAGAVNGDGVRHVSFRLSLMEYPPNLRTRGTLGGSDPLERTAVRPV